MAENMKKDNEQTSEVAETKKAETKEVKLIKLDGEEIGKSDVYVKENVDAITVFDLFSRMLKTIFTGKY